jgi:hypothetical protein
MNSICKTALVAALVIAGVSRADAQGLNGNLFAGLGAFNCCNGSAGAWQVGGGIDVPVTTRLTIGGDGGAIGPSGDGEIAEQLDGLGGSTAMFATSALVSITATYHVGRRPAPLFVTAGYGAAIAGGGGVGGFLFGGGIDWWLRGRRGVRVEVRDQLLEEFGTTHLLTFRAGWLFR